MSSNKRVTNILLYAALTLSGKRTALYRFTPKSGFTDYFDEDGQLTHFLGAFQDITERRHPDGGPDMENFDHEIADAENGRSRRLDAVGNEIKTLLDIVISSSELMLWQQE